MRSFVTALLIFILLLGLVIWDSRTLRQSCRQALEAAEALSNDPTEFSNKENALILQEVEQILEKRHLWLDLSYNQDWVDHVRLKLKMAQIAMQNNSFDLYLTAKEELVFSLVNLCDLSSLNPVSVL